MAESLATPLISAVASGHLERPCKFERTCKFERMCKILGLWRHGAYTGASEPR